MRFSVPETCLASMGDVLLYAHPLGDPRDDVDRQKSRLSDTTDCDDLVNEELPDSMAFYYGNVIYTDEMIRRGAFLNL